MKTPKRTYVTSFLEWGDEFQGRLSSGQQRAYARWKRKNRIAQLKRTIARLEAENFELEYLSTRIIYDGTMSDMLTFYPHHP